MPRIAGMPMGRGAPRLTTPTTHVIEEDGTYSNHQEVVEETGLKGTVKVHQKLLFADSTKWYVLEVYDYGLHLATWPRKTLPSMEDGRPILWEELTQKGARVVNG